MIKDMLLNNKKMTCIVKIKRIFVNFLETRDYKNLSSRKKSKAIYSDKSKYKYYCNILNKIKSRKFYFNYQILIGNEKNFYFNYQILIGNEIKKKDLMNYII